MNYTSSKVPPTVSTYRNYNTEVQRVLQASDRDGEKLSPVNLRISEATPIQLPPLNWVNYQVTPSNMFVWNNGFTVMINNKYDEEMPYVNSGPLQGNYVFQQAHFHWGERDDTGSSHATDGMRYPLEMHVIHARKGCTNLREAFMRKDSIAVMVHLFAVREERNTQMDQLTAILQFIQRPKCFARLLSVPLAEIVQPFTSDYFTYWGTVGTPRGHCRIQWLVSRNVLPVSSQQLKEFRQLRDPKGEPLLTNSSKPQPLAGRSLFLVSPSQRTNETMYGVPRRKTQPIGKSESQDSVDIKDAEYKSLADLEELNDLYEDDSSEDSHYRMCRTPKRLKHTANINIGYPYKLNEGDTSIEESCVDLGSNESGLTVQTETKYRGDTKGQRLITNVNVSTGRQYQTYKTKYPAEAVYSVLSARGSELHLRHRPTIVRPSDPSTEQACLFLTGPTHSAPSLTGGGFLTQKQEHTDVPNKPIENFSSELAVFNRDSDTEVSNGLQRLPDPQFSTGMGKSAYYDYEETNFREKNLKSSKNVKRVVFKEAENPRRAESMNYYEDMNAPSYLKETDAVSILETQKEPLRNETNFYYPNGPEKEYYSEKLENTLRSEEHSKYLKLKQGQKKNEFVKVLQESPVNSTVPLSFKNNQSTVANNNSIVNNQYQDKSVHEEVPVKSYDYNKPSKLSENNNKKKTLVQLNKDNQTVNDQNFQISYQHDEFYDESERKQKSHKKVYFMGKTDEPAIRQSERNEGKENEKSLANNRKNNFVKVTRKNDKYSDPHYRVSLVVHTTVSDHRKLGRKGKTRKEYYIAKILPKETRIYVTPTHSTSDVKKDAEEFYYAKPLVDDDQTYPEKDDSSQIQKHKNSSNKRGSEYLNEYYEKTSQEFFEETKNNHMAMKTYGIKNNPTKSLQPSTNPNQIMIAPEEKQSHENPNERQIQGYSEEVTENEKSEFQQQENKHRTLKSVQQFSIPQANTQGPQNNQLENADTKIKPSANFPQIKEPIKSSNKQQSYEYNEEVTENERSEFKHKENIHRRLQSIQSPKPTLLPPQGSRSYTKLNNPDKGHIVSENKNVSLVGNKNTLLESREDTLNKNLVQKTNVYHSRNDPDEDVFVIGKTITGKVGESHSTDVIVKSKHTEILNPKRTDVSKEVDYKLTRSKHPEEQYVAKEPSTVIRQKLSLDQKIQGHSQVRQTVEYHDGKRAKPGGNTDTNKSKPDPETQISPQIPRNKFSSVTKAYEESSQEQSSTVKKSQYHTLRNVQLKPLQNRKINSSFVSDHHEEPMVNKDYSNNLHTDNQGKEQQKSEQAVEYKSGNQFNADSELKEQEPIPNTKKNTDGEFQKLSEVYEESSLEKSSAVKKSHQQTYNHLQPEPNEDSNFEAAKLVEKNQLNSLDFNENILQQEKVEVLKQSGIDTKLMLPKAHYKVNTLKQSFSDILPRRQNANEDKYPEQQRDLRNEFEETSSLQQQYEHSKREKMMIRQHQNENDQLVKNKPQLQQHTNEKVIEDQKSLVKQTPKTVSNKVQDQLMNNMSEGLDYEETTEESESVYVTQKITGKTRTIQKKGETSYKLPKQSTNTTKDSDSDYVVEVKKVEMPDPHYITRVPKQPLIEFEAYPVDPQQPFEIVMETSEEVSSVVKTNKTYMMFKKINGKAVLNQPSIIEPMKLEKGNKDKFPYSDTSVFRPSQISKEGARGFNEAKYEKELEPTEKLPEVHKDSVAYNPQTQKESSFDTDIQQKSPPKNTNAVGLLTEYEYSESSLLSQRKVVQKEKKYKYKVQQASANAEENKKPFPDSKIPALKTVEEVSSSQSNDGTIISVQRSYIEKENIEKKTKIVVGSYQQSMSAKPPSITPPDLQPNRTVNKIQDQPPSTVETGVEVYGPGQYLDEEYFESSTKEQKYQSSKKQFISMGGTQGYNNYQTKPNQFGKNQSGPSSQQFVPLNHLNSTGKESNYPEINDEPTKDTPTKMFDSHSKGENIGIPSESSSEDQENSKKNQKSKYQLYVNDGRPTNSNAFKGGKGSIPLNQSVLNNKVPISETDGDIVIYIRQPRAKKEHVSPKITVDVTESQHLTASDLSAQQVQIHEIKTEKSKKRNTSKNTSKTRRTKSADNYHSPISTESSTEESGKTISSESNEEQIIDTTHYNLTLKSETQVELESGRTANVKSKAEVRINPLGSRPGSPEVVQRSKSKGRERLSYTEDATSRLRDSDSNSHSSSSFEEPTVSNFSAFNQSPIKIDSQSSEVKNCPKLQFFNHWDAGGDALIENNGKTLRGSYVQDSALPYIQGGPLKDVYVFSELHFHWGHKDCCGAEHIIDGQRHTLEAHFLYFKKEYGLLKEAMKHEDGIAVVAVNLNVGGPPNPQLGELIKDIPLLKEPDTGTYVPAHSLFSWMKPVVSSSQGYFSYKGSLTGDPPHVESVTWMIFPEPIIFCCQQSREFRKLKSKKGQLLTKNYRPPQPINNRPLYFVPLS